MFAMANNNYKFSEDHRTAYELIIAMRFDEAQDLIKKIKRDQPEDLLVYHIENYIDFISIFISEEKDEFKAKEPNKDIRLAKLKQGDANDPYFLFSQAEVHLQWAMTRIKFEEYFSAALEVNKAIGMLEENQNRFPNFISNKKSLSILHAVAGTIPDKYKGVIELVSNFNGTIDQGLLEIEEVLAYSKHNDYFFEKEAVAIKAMILLHLKNKKEDSWNFLSTSSISREDNPMATFLLASTAMNCGRNEEAIKILKKRTRSPRYFPFYYLDLMLGTAKLSRMDKDADVYIKSYIHNFQGKDYFKDAYRKLAWHALTIMDNEKGYLGYMELCERVGNANIDEDKSALKEAKKKTVPHRKLLKARLLYDGGYLSDAQAELESIDHGDLTSEENIEFLYRKARVQHNMKNIDQALIFYKNCLSMCGDSKLYYCSNSALQMGIIYEEKNEIEEARVFYERCLSMNSSEYNNSLHQKAKSGLTRIRKR
ncbi:hypothetical protein GCM10007940_36160 [Portibacter lacus]|uniref:Tetratricopeptide repeat protein n=2 Tax=Portibacter lacus TaxID=1099794 RepID=A0AA37STH5_9BACT|nr:hypothetical protein GCM10007940_36160 [Portibacter lacus]